MTVADILAKSVKEKPFKFTQFPLAIKGDEVFRPAVDDCLPYVNSDPIRNVFKAIRQHGNWPTFMLRMPNLEDRIIGMLLDTLTDYPDLTGEAGKDVYISMEVKDYTIGNMVPADQFSVSVVLVTSRGEHLANSVQFFKPKKTTA